MIRALIPKTPSTLRGIPSVVTHTSAGMRGGTSSLIAIVYLTSGCSFELHEFPGP